MVGWGGRSKEGASPAGCGLGVDPRLARDPRHDALFVTGAAEADDVRGIAARRRGAAVPGIADGAAGTAGGAALGAVGAGVAADVDLVPEHAAGVKAARRTIADVAVSRLAEDAVAVQVEAAGTRSE